MRKKCAQSHRFGLGRVAGGGGSANREPDHRWTVQGLGSGALFRRRCHADSTPTVYAGALGGFASEDLPTSASKLSMLGLLMFALQARDSALGHWVFSAVQFLQSRFECMDRGLSSV